MLDSIAAAGQAPPAVVDQCKAEIRLGRLSEMSNALKQTLLIDSTALTELHHEVWSVQSVQLAAKDRATVRLPADQFALTQELAES